MFSEIVEENGKTIRQNNLELKHKYPIGTLVEFEVDHCGSGNAFIKGKAQAYVCHQGRDCDGSPLYDMCLWRPDMWEDLGYSTEEWSRQTNGLSPRSLSMEAIFQIWFRNYGEDSLKQIES